MFCSKCGAKAIDGAEFCQKCGAKVIYADNDISAQNTSPQAVSEYVQEAFPNVPASAIEHNEGYDDRISASEPPRDGTPDVEEDTSKFKIWWDNCSKPQKVISVLLALVVGIFALCLLVSFLRKFGYLLLGILILASLLFSLFIGSKEEKLEARKTIVQLTGGFVIICIIAVIVAKNPDIISDIFQPGAGVRNAYLSEYSEKVTVEEAFESYFDNEKWSTYKDKGYSYVVFTGTCEYLSEKADVRVTFKITGDNFRTDSLELNGVEQSDLILTLMLAEIYEKY